MNHGARAKHPAGRPIRTGAVGPTAALGDEGWWCVMKRDQTEGVAFAKVEVTETGGTEPDCIYQHGVKYWLQLARRTGDDAQHIGCRSLLLQRFAQLVEQARILDRDHRLRREVLSQLDLLVGERPDFLAVDGNGAD